MWMKRITPLLLVLLLTLAGSPMVCAESVSPTLSVTQAEAVKGSTVTVQVVLSDGNGICGGGLTVCYDRSALTLKEVSAETFDGMTIIVNNKYRENAVRVSLAGAQALPQGRCALLTLTFAVSSTAEPGLYPVTLESTRLYDRDIASVTHQTQSGGVTVLCVGLTIQTVEAAATQSVKVPILLNTGLYPAGGSFEIHYDADMLTVGATAKGDALPSGTGLVSHASTPGVLKVSWAGTDRAAQGVLCTLTFNVKSGASGNLAIKMQNIRMYDPNSTLMDVSVTNGAIRIVVPTEGSPKLWVVGGVTDENGIAKVGIVLEGHGSICGGSFTLSYDPTSCELTECSLPAELRSSMVVNSPLNESGSRTEAGTIKAAWADAVPSVKSQMLLELTFRVQRTGSALALSEVKTLDAGGKPVASVDLRPGTIRSEEAALQLPDLHLEQVQTTASGISVRTTVDVANARQFSGNSVENVRIFAVLYENGQMKTVEIAPQHIAFDENGIATMELETSCKGDATVVKVFFLQEDTHAPCAETAELILEQGR